MTRKRRKQIQCQHLHAAGIYGDGINLYGKRGHCYECGTRLDALPYTFESETASHRVAFVHPEGDGAA